MNVNLSHTYTERTIQITAKKCNVFRQRGHVRPAIKAKIGAAKLLMNYVRAERILMKLHPEMSEKWIQAKIAEDPSILGLGDLVLRAQERIHPKAGRLDLPLQDPDNARRYESSCNSGPRMNRISSGPLSTGTSNLSDILEGAGIETLEEYNGRWAMYRLRLARGDVENKHDAVLQLTKLAYAYRNS